MNDVAAHINAIIPPAAGHETYARPLNGCWEETHDKGKLSVTPALSRYCPLPLESPPNLIHRQKGKKLEVTSLPRVFLLHSSTASCQLMFEACTC